MVAKDVAEAEVAMVTEVVEADVEVVVAKKAVARRQNICQETSGMHSVLKNNRPFEMLETQLVLEPSARLQQLTLTQVGQTRKHPRMERWATL